MALGYFVRVVNMAIELSGCVRGQSDILSAFKGAVDGTLRKPVDKEAKQLILVY